MRAPRFSIVAGLAGLAIAASTLLAPASFAQGRHDSTFFSDAYSQSSAERGAGSYYTYPGSIPRDYSSSHLCINGYRWITQQQDLGEDPAANATPVRCR
jgi:hypothetical protein